MSSRDAAKASGLIAATADTGTYTWLFMSVGALLDQALLMKLKSELDMEQIGGIMAIIDPLRLAPGEAATASDGKRAVKESTRA
jgi:hypothetical protein